MTDLETIDRAELKVGYSGKSPEHEQAVYKYEAEGATEYVLARVGEKYPENHEKHSGLLAFMNWFVVLDEQDDLYWSARLELPEVIQRSTDILSHGFPGLVGAARVIFEHDPEIRGLGFNQVNDVVAQTSHSIRAVSLNSEFGLMSYGLTRTENGQAFPRADMRVKRSTMHIDTLSELMEQTATPHIASRASRLLPLLSSEAITHALKHPDRD